MSNGPFIGRTEGVGFGFETTPGTAVAPVAWQRHLKLALNHKTTVAQNKSAMGRIEDINDSLVTEEWAEGSLNGKVTDITIGYPLKNMFGIAAAGLHSGETLVYDNTFTVSQVNAPNTMTLTRVSPLIARRYALGTLNDFELDVQMGGWAQFTSTFVAKVGVTSSDTIAFTTENEFTSKHVVVKLASTVGGLGAATPPQLKSLKLKIARKADRFVPMGVIDPTSFDTNSWGVTGEFVLRYTDTSLETLALANTRQAMSIALINTDTTIGTASNPSLTFTAPKVRLAPITLDDTLDQPLSQTVLFSCELDTALAYMMQAVLVNIKNGY